VNSERLGADTPPIIAEVSSESKGDTHVMKLCPDSGATISLCSKDLAHQFHLKMDTNKLVRLKDVQGQPIKCLGVATVYIKAPCGPKVAVKVAITAAMKKQL